MSVALQQLIDDVVGVAEGGPPEAAAEVYGDAARSFRAFARQPQYRNLAAVLAAHANEFDARAQSYRAFHATGPTRQRPVTRIDIDEQERDLAQAHAEVGELDDLEIKARRNQLAKLRDHLRRVSIAPESVTEDSCRLGNQVQVKFNPTQADRVNHITSQDTVVLWQGKKVEAQAFTVDAGVTTVPALSSGVSCRPFGIITYGSDGFQMSFTFDVQLGVRLTGVGNYCSVLVGMGAPRSTLDSGVMTIGASLGFFAATSQAPVTFSTYLDALAAAPAPAAASTTQIARPSRASFLLPPQASDPNGSTQLDFYDYSGAIVNTLLFANGTVVAPIPLFGEIASVAVTNRGANVGNFRLPWQLST